jgi:hypothetical protein
VSDYARAALLAVVEHWPGRLDDLALRAQQEVNPTLGPGIAGVSVWRAHGEGLLLRFPHRTLGSDHPTLAFTVQRAYRRWHAEPPEPDPTPDHTRAALRVLVTHWPGVLNGVTLTGALMRSAAAGVLVQQDGRTLQVGFTRDELEHAADPATAANVVMAYRAWMLARAQPEPPNPPYA